MRAARFAIIGFVLLKCNAGAADNRWLLTFDEEFNGTDVDFNRWTPHDPTGQERRGELQAYVPGSVQFGDGAIHLVAKREKATYDGHLRTFTSGTATTIGLFAQTYGRFEIRCRFPKGAGLEASASLQPVPDGDLPSIDIVRVAGAEPSLARFGNQWGDEMTERSWDGSYAIGTPADGFHDFAVEWEATRIVWYIDGKERFRSIEGIPHQPMYIALRLAVGGETAHWPAEETRFPASFDVDYIRVYKRN